MIKLIALDMDGTLLNNKKEIAQAQIDAIHQAVKKGVKLVLCTGRPLVGVKPYYDQLGLSREQEYVIVNNGCSTHQTSDWALVDWRELSKDEMIYLNELSKKVPHQLSLFDDRDYFIVDEIPNDLVVFDASLVFTSPKTISIEEATNGEKIMFQAMYLGEKDLLDDFEKEYGETLSQKFSCVRSQEYIYETMPKGTTKASTLAILAKKLGILPEEIMALGDGNNDIEMLEFAGLGVAMGNATEQVKEIANAITTSNEENGVAKAIQDYVLADY